MLKSTTYNPDRRLLRVSLFFLSFAIILVVKLLIETNANYPSYIISSIGIISILGLIIKRFGAVSVPSLLSMVLFFPTLSPFFAHVIFKADYYSWNNRFLQEDTNIVNKACFIIFLALIIYYLTLVFFEDRKKHIQVSSYDSTNLIFRKNTFVFFCCLFLFFVWLTEPGPTLLSADYTTLLQARFKGTQFAGAFVVIFWALAFMNYRNYKKGKLKKFFEIITFVGVLWLLLHARRNELLGILFISILYLSERTSQKKVVFWGLISLFGLVIIGKIRSMPILDQSYGDILNAVAGVRVFHEIGRFASLPGGASNIFVTMLDTIYLMDVMNYGFLYGKTYVQYIYNMIPLNLINFLGLPQPSYFSHIIAQNFEYNGGIYVFAPAYANFGLLGVLFVSAFLGRIVIFTSKNFKSKRYLFQGISLIVIALFARGMWYGPIAIMKPVVVIGAVYLYIRSKSRRIRVLSRKMIAVRNRDKRRNYTETHAGWTGRSCRGHEQGTT